MRRAPFKVHGEPGPWKTSLAGNKVHSCAPFCSQSRLVPTIQCLPKVCCCDACELRMIFTFLVDSIRKKRASVQAPYHLKTWWVYPCILSSFWTPDLRIGVAAFYTVSPLGRSQSGHSLTFHLLLNPTSSPNICQLEERIWTEEFSSQDVLLTWWCSWVGIRLQGLLTQKQFMIYY